MYGRRARSKDLTTCEIRSHLVLPKKAHFEMPSSRQECGKAQKMLFGFDVGTTSIGWAIISIHDEANSKLLAMGLRIFPEARDLTGLPLNHQRRTARQIRCLCPSVSLAQNDDDLL
jgi:hypothetical protein